MPNTILFPDVRLALARLYIEIGRSIHVVLDLSDDGAGADCDLVLICAGILVGQIEGQSATASSLSRYLEMPRTTIMRKIKTLQTRGVVAVSEGGRYSLIPSRFGRKTKELERSIRLVETTYKKILRARTGQTAQTGQYAQSGH